MRGRRQATSFFLTERSPLSKLRGYTALVVICLVLFLEDPIQRLVIAPWARLFPSRRIAVFGRWQRFQARFILRVLSAVGGVRLPEVPKLPGKAGTLILMNHQSILDIPILVASVTDGYPLIVARKRYFRWIPLISHMLRLYQYPMVDPTANADGLKEMIDGIRDAARDAEVPFGIFPEGTRTKDGEIARFRSTGLKAILSQRPWTVYAIVVDGFWERAKFKHFVAGMDAVDGRAEVLGPFEWRDPEAHPGSFIRDIRAQMVERLARMRAASAA